MKPAKARISALLVCGVSAMAVLIGCARSEAEAAEAQTTPAPQTNPADAPAAPQPKVQLLAPGQEPRMTLALEPVNGNSFVFAISAGLAMEQIADGKITRQQVPVTMFVLNILVKDAAHAEGILCEFVCVNALPVADAQADEATLQMMRDMLGPMVGMGGRMIISRDGFVRNLEPNLPPNFSGMSRMHVTGMVQALQLAAIPLPSEPVGVEGQWKVEMPIVQNGTKMNHQAIYTVHALTDARVDIEVKIVQEGGEQEVIANEALPMPLHVKSARNDGTGHAVLRLDRVLPLEYTLSLQGKSHVIMDAGERKVDLVQQATSELEFGDPPADLPAPPTEPQSEPESES